tara:strand:+ start:276 stop:1322 length:1047 start_codon:yes stop_codon:yes gene_type:complete
MEIEDIWISIIMPLILGPLFVFLKTIWDKTNEAKQNKKKMQFDEKRSKLKHQLDDFYYPVYLKLLLLYSLSFILPQPKSEEITDKEDAIERESVSSSESEFCSSDEEFNENTESNNKKQSYRKKRCMAYYKINNEYIKCRKIIPKTGYGKICRCCRWKFLGGKIDIHILENEDHSENSVFYSPNLDQDQESSTKTIKKLTKRRGTKNSLKDITIQIPEFVDLQDLEATDINSNKLMNQVNLLSISISEKTVPIIRKVCNEYYKQIAESIENTIHIIEPNTRLTKHLISFLKYSKIVELIYDNDLCQMNDCKPEDFGAKNNLNELLGHIEANLNKYGNQYKKLMENGNI